MPEKETSPNPDLALIHQLADQYKFKNPESAKRFTSGQINRVYDIDEQFILKIKGDGVKDLDLFSWQAAVVNKLHDLGLKIPKIIDYGKTDEHEFLLMEKLSGHSLSHDWLSLDEATRQDVTQQLVAQLRILHSLDIDHYSIPIVNDAQHATLREAVAHITNFADIDRTKLISPHLEDFEFLEDYFKNNIHLLEEQHTAVPVHHDVNLENILWADGKITGLIDIDWMSYAPKDYELKRIVHYAHTPKNCVQEDLEAAYAKINLVQEVKWLKEAYPELFEGDHLVERIRLYLVDQMLMNFRWYTTGRYGENLIAENHQQIADYYRNDWLPNTLGM